MEMRRDEERVRQNLIDAGCDRNTISDFFHTAGSADSFSKRLLLLKRHRKKLLDDIHNRQREIDCLDYLIHQLENQN